MIGENPFRALEDFYLKKIQKHLSDHTWQEILYNKSVTQLFLDKAEKSYPKGHPFLKSSKQFEWNSSTFASMEISRYLTALLESPHLQDKAKLIIKSWLASEQAYLPFAIIFDGWRIANPGVLEAVKDSNEKTQEILGQIKNKTSPEEIHIMAQFLLEQLTHLENGKSLKFLGGTFAHEVRIVFTKDAEQNTFTITEFNPAKKESLVISNVKAEHLLNQEFLIKFVESKLSTHGTTQLEKLGSVKKIRDEYSKGAQVRNSCPLQTILKEFKSYFLSSYASKEEGYGDYKIIKGLMAAHALQNDRTHLNPAIFEALEIKEAMRSRVLKWIELMKNPDEFQKALNFYQKAFAILKIDFPRNLTGMPLIAALDHRLNSIVGNQQLIPEEMHKLFELCSQIEAPLPLGILIKQSSEAKIIRKTLSEALEYHKSFGGKAANWISQQMKEYLPENIQGPIKEAIWDGKITLKDLKTILEHPIGISPEDYLRMIQDLVQENVITKKDIKKIAERMVFNDSNDPLQTNAILKHLQAASLLDEIPSKSKKSLLDKLSSIEDEATFFSLIDRALTHEYSLDLQFLLSRRLLSDHFEKDIYIPNITQLYEKDIISGYLYQQLIFAILESKKIQLDEVHTLLKALPPQETLIEFTKILLDRDDGANKHILHVMEKGNDQDKVDLIGKLWAYQPKKITFAFSKLAENQPSQRLVERFIMRLINLDPKPSVELVESILDPLTSSLAPDFFVFFLDKNLMEQEVLTHPVIHSLVKKQFQQNRITKEQLLKWHTRIETALKARIEAQDLPFRIAACQNALSVYRPQ